MLHLVAVTAAFVAGLVALLALSVHHPLAAIVAAPFIVSAVCLLGAVLRVLRPRTRHGLHVA